MEPDKFAFGLIVVIALSVSLGVIIDHWETQCYMNRGYVWVPMAPGHWELHNAEKGK